MTLRTARTLLLITSLGFASCKPAEPDRLARSPVTTATDYYGDVSHLNSKVRETFESVVSVFEREHVTLTADEKSNLAMFIDDGIGYTKFFNTPTPLSPAARTEIEALIRTFNDGRLADNGSAKRVNVTTTQDGATLAIRMEFAN